MIMNKNYLLWVENDKNLSVIVPTSENLEKELLETCLDPKTQALTCKIFVGICLFLFKYLLGGGFILDGWFLVSTMTQIFLKNKVVEFFKSLPSQILEEYFGSTFGDK